MVQSKPELKEERDLFQEIMQGGKEMFKWLSLMLQEILQRPYTKAADEIDQLVRQISNISEPVISIVKTFDEKGRWKIKPLFDVYGAVPRKEAPSWEAIDTVTGEKHTIYSDSFYYLDRGLMMFVIPTGTWTYHMPSWMTEVEKEYVCKAIEKKMLAVNERLTQIKDKKRRGGEKQALINQQKERTRIMKLYVGEGE